MVRSFPLIPESGEAPEDIESESLLAVDSEAEVSEEGEDDDDGDEFFLARRGRPADDLIDMAGSSPSNHHDGADATADTSAPAGQKRAASAFVDEDALWSL